MLAALNSTQKDSNKFGHVRAHTNTHTYTHTHTHTHTQKHIQTNTQARMHANSRTHTHIHARTQKTLKPDPRDCGFEYHHIKDRCQDFAPNMIRPTLARPLRRKNHFFAGVLCEPSYCRHKEMHLILAVIKN